MGLKKKGDEGSGTSEVMENCGQDVLDEKKKSIFNKYF